MSGVAEQRNGGATTAMISNGKAKASLCESLLGNAKAKQGRALISKAKAEPSFEPRRKGIAKH